MDYDLTPVRAGCPVCNDPSAERLYRVSPADVAVHFLSAASPRERLLELERHVEQLWGQSSCDVLRCRGCEFGYAWPFRAGDPRFYELAFPEPGGYPDWKWEHQQTLESIRADVLPYAPAAPDVLEIGAGDGTFVRGLLPDMTRPDRVVCTEYSSSGADRIRQLGVTCHELDARDLLTGDGRQRFNIICMFQVLEHLDDLNALFEALARGAAENAHLYVAVPNPRFTEFNETHGSLLEMPPNHVGRWNADSFRIIGERHGWRLAAHRIEPGEPFGHKAHRHLNWSYLRRSQRPTWLQRRAFRMRNARLRALTHVALLTCHGLRKLPDFYALRSDAYSPGQWAHLLRIEGE